MTLSVILILYIGIAALAAAGTVTLISKRLSPRIEQIFFGVLLTPIAAIYLAFTAYFGADDAWWLEAAAVLLFALLGTLGSRVVVVLVLGYVLHGAWDLLHELYLHVGVGVDGAANLSEIPLAYGVFCAAYDWCMAVYFVSRRKQWNAAWRVSAD